MALIRRQVPRRGGQRIVGPVFEKLSNRMRRLLAKQPDQLRATEVF